MKRYIRFLLSALFCYGVYTETGPITAIFVLLVGVALELIANALTDIAAILKMEATK